MKTRLRTLLKRLVLGAGFFMLTQQVSAQSLGNYGYSAGNSSYSHINILTGATEPSRTSGTTDEGYYNNLPVGFDFYYMGARYTTFSASSNGWLTLGQAITDAAPTNSLATVGNRAVIAPLWDNLSLYGGFLTLAAGSFSYQTAGTAGSRILTVQWNALAWNNTNDADVLACQVKLYEATGAVLFTYNRGPSNPTAPSASVGITSGGVGPVNFLSISDFTTLPSVGVNSEYNNIAIRPATGQVYTATPSASAAPTALTFSSIGANHMMLNWVDNSSDEIGFAIYRSTDNTNFTYVGTTAANATSSSQSGLTLGTTYYWKVFALKESLSTPLTGSAVTTCSGVSISQTPTGNVIGNYRFSGNANDANGTNNGTLRGSPTATADRFGTATRAYAFNGTSQYVSTANSYANPTNFTVSIWFRTTTVTGGKLIGFGGSQTGLSTNYDRHIYMNNAGQLYFGVNPNPIKTLNTTQPYNDGAWHLVTGTLSSTAGLALYVDGNLIASDASAVLAQNYTGYWRIGYDNLDIWPSAPTSRYFNGSLDDAIVYHRALSAAEVMTLYKSPDGAGNNGPVCVGATLTLSATTLANATYSWTGPNGFTSALQNPTLSFTTAAAGIYTVQVTQYGCSNTASTTVTTTGVGQWTGNTNTGWAVAANWCSGTVPVAATNAIIPSGLTNYPVVSTTQPVNDITITSGASVSVTGILQIGRAINNSGTFTVSNGGIDLEGTAAQQLPANVFASNLINNLTINNTAGVTLGGALKLTGLLTITAGNFATAGFLTLGSTATQTANVSAVPASYSITGNVTVERFVTGGAANPYRTYRMFSSPVYDNTTTFINTNTPGNRSYKFSQFIDDMIITGAGGAANGFDATSGNLASAFIYNSNFIAVPDINLQVNIGNGAYIFFRGDRSNYTAKTNAPFANPENTVITYKGILNQQSVTVPLTYAAASNGRLGFNLIGNPYASTIDWSSANWVASDKVNISNSTWTWNPATRTYATFSAGVGANGGSRYIASGQSFFVQTTAAAGSVTFKESIKASTQQPAILLLRAPSLAAIQAVNRETFDVPTALKLIRIKLKKPGAYNEDETVVVFQENGNAAVDLQDAGHFDGEAVFLSSLSSDLASLAINFMPSIDDVSQIGLNVNATASGTYTLDFSLAEFPAGYVVQLKDNFLNTITDVSPGLVHSFTIDKTAAATFGTGRFSLLISPHDTLPLEMVDFRINKVVEGVKLQWEVTPEDLEGYFDVQRAGSDRKFESIGTVVSGQDGNFELIDKSPLAGNNYYQLTLVEKNGTAKTYGPLGINYTLSSVNNNVLNIYPNPVADQVTIKYNGLLKGGLQTLRIVSTSGQKVDEVVVTTDQLNSGYVYNAARVPSGLYLLEVYEKLTGKKISVIKMIKL